MNSTVLLKRGIKADLPDRLPLGEVVFCTDTSELYVGMGDLEPPKKASANISAEEIGDVANLETDYRSTIVGAINELNKKIRYLEENGAIGGNNSAPIVSSDHSKYTYTTDEEINISYYVVDAEGGKMTATYIINGETRTEEISIGYNTLKLGKMDKGTYDVRMFVKDRGGLLSNELRFLLTVGSLELTSIFDPTNEGNDFEFGEPIEITYFIANLEDEPVDVDLTVDDRLIQTDTVRPGTNKVSLPPLQIGNHTVKLRGFNGKVYSNTLEYIITVTNSSSLLLSTTFNPQDNITVSDRVVIPFRISLKEGKKFKVYRTHTYKNTVTELPTMTGYLGVNTWDLGYLGAGSHHITIRATTEDGLIESINTIDMTINVESANFTPISPIKDETLALQLTCKNKSNQQDDKGVWEDTSGNQVQTTLHNFNYVNNGWFEDYLRINGDAYVEIDLKPLMSGVRKRGFTFDVEYQYFNLGDKNARIVSCETLLSYDGTEGATELYLGEGLRIACDGISITGSGATTESPHSEDLWTRATFVVDPVLKVVLIYVDGIISSVRNLGDNQTFVTESKIYLGCCLNSQGEVSGNCDCKIKNLRVYNRALSHEEVLQNYQSDMIVPDQIESVRRNLGNDLPELEIYGNYAGMSGDVDVPMDLVRYQPKNGEGLSFELHGKCEMGWQGNSSLKYPVKNYDLTLVEDDGTEFKRQFKPDWMIRDSFHIKANMIDSSHSFNLGIAKFVSQLYTVKTPPMESDPLIRYAVDGFPVLLYENGKYSGLYTWNLHQHRNVFGLKKSNPDHIMYRAEENSAQGSVAFRYWGEEDTVAEDGSYIGGIKSEWEKRHPKPKDNPDNTELAKLIEWVATCSDEEFVREINAGRRFKKEFLIDYFIVAYTFAMVDSLGKNMTLTTWEKDENGNAIWYCMFYDMDTAFGFNNEGALVFPPDLTLTDKPGFNTSSYLWERVQKLFAKDIKERYREMRRTRMKIDTFINIMEEELIGRVGEKFMNLDVLTKYIPYGTNYTHMAKGKKYHHLRDWLKARFLLLDSEFDFTREDDNDQVIIRSDKLGVLEFRIKTYSPQYITVDFGGNNVHTKLCTPDEYTVFTHNHDGSHKDLSISGASYITHLEGLENQNVSMLNVEYCKRLLSLKIAGNPLLRTLDVSTCERLTYIDCSNCTGLMGELNVNKCFNLKHLDCSNTKIDTVLFSGCSYLRYLNFNNTRVQKLTVANMTNIESISITGMEYLNNLEVLNCAKLRLLDTSNSTSITAIKVHECPEFYSLTCTNNTSLATLDIDYCPNLVNINVAGCSSLCGTLDLSGYANFQTLLSHNSSLEHVIFNPQSRIVRYTPSKQTIRTITDLYLHLASIPTADDRFSDCTLLETFTNTTIDFSGLNSQATIVNYFARCSSLTKLPDRFIAPSSNNTSGLCMNCTSLEVFDMEVDLGETLVMTGTFNGCTKLREVTVPLVAPKCHTIHQMFYNCQKLTTIDLSSINPTSLSQLFHNCSELESFKLGDTSKVQDWSHAFNGCNKVKDLSSLRIGENANLYFTFANCHSATRFPNFLDTKVGSMSTTFANCTSYTGSLEIDCTHIRDLPNTFNGMTNLTSVTLRNSDNLNSLQSTFYACTNLSEIRELTIGSSMTDVNGAFNRCKSLPSLPPITDFSNVKKMETFCNEAVFSEQPSITLDCSSVTSMGDAFRASSFESITLLNTNNVTDFRGTFSYNENLKTVGKLVLPSLTTFNGTFAGTTNLGGVIDLTIPLVKELSNLFSGNKCIEELYIRDSVSLTNLGGVCNGCTNLRKAHIPKTPYVTSLYHAFNNCTSLTDLVLGDTPLIETLQSAFNSTAITTMPLTATRYEYLTIMSGAFSYCANLTVDVYLDLPKVSRFDSTFRGSGITSLRLSDATQPEQMSYVIHSCPNITHYEFNGINITGVNNHYAMTRNALNLQTIIAKNLRSNNAYTSESGFNKLPRLTKVLLPGCETDVCIGRGNLDATALNNLFESLPSISSSKTIYYGVNLGSSYCDPSIATNKGWRASNSSTVSA